MGGAASSPVRATAVGGPVILGGDDLTDHGRRDPTTGANQEGWLYMQRALENIRPNVRRANDNSVAALGSSETGGGAGSAIKSAATAAGLTVTYHNGGPNITAFFTSLRAGAARPAIIWISGNGAGNDLNDDPTEALALQANATAIADFVNSGGGLLSHGTEYGWLSALLPGATAVNSGGGSLALTPEGSAAFPGLTNADINSGPWHNHFEGNFGGLGVLVRATSVRDAAGNAAAVVLGGSAVQLPGSITLEPSSSENAVGTTHTVTATIRNNAGALQPGVQVTFLVTAGPNAGATGTGTTDANGQASFAWTGVGAGEDTVTASFVDGSGNTHTTTATKRWVAAAVLPVQRTAVMGVTLTARGAGFEAAARVAGTDRVSGAEQSSAQRSELPATGLRLGTLLSLAAAFLLGGVGLLGWARRRTAG